MAEWLDDKSVRSIPTLVGKTLTFSEYRKHLKRSISVGWQKLGNANTLRYNQSVHPRLRGKNYYSIIFG
jgi:hypothetical protein